VPVGYEGGDVVVGCGVCSLGGCWRGEEGWEGEEVAGTSWAVGY
jgi:hypothetical protein